MWEMMYPRNFKREDMFFSATAARKGIDNRPVDSEIEVNMLATARYLQELRDKLSNHFGVQTPITVYSCYRSPKLNKAVGGSKTSAHMKALAADIVVKGMSPRSLAQFIVDNCEFDQVILEFDQWVHVGIPTEKSKRGQILTAKKEKTAFGRKTVYKSGLV